jgi:hypothetical protein
MQSGVYLITNTVTGECYVGCSTYIPGRWRSHQLRFEQGNHHNPRLRDSCAVHGSTAFKFEVLEFCDPDHVKPRENVWIRKLRPILNGPRALPKENKKPKNGCNGRPIGVNLYVSYEFRDAVDEYRCRYGLPDRSAAMRHAIERTLRSEGILPSDIQRAG